MTVSKYDIIIIDKGIFKESRQKAGSLFVYRKEVRDVAEELTKTDKFKRNSKKIKMAEMLANPEFTGTNKQIQEAIGISHETFYKWIKEKEMLDYIEQLVDRYTDGELAAVWKALVKKCKGGDTQAIKLYFELKGKYCKNADNNADRNGSGGGVVILPEITEEGGNE